MIFVIIGTLIGAGFASGQEIYLFFYRFGFIGIAGIILSITLLSVIIYKVLKNPKVIRKSKIVNAFVLFSFFIMIAGFGAYLEEQCGLHHMIGSAILAIACFFILQKNTYTVIKANTIIVPVLIVFLVLIGVLTIINSNPIFSNNIIEKMPNSIYRCILSSFLYAGYNSILLIPVLVSIFHTNKENTKSKLLQVSVISGIISASLGLIIFIILTNLNPVDPIPEMPVAYVLLSYPYTIQIAYGFVILASIFTSSISLGAAVLENVKVKIKSHRSLSTAILCIMATIFSNIRIFNTYGICLSFFSVHLVFCKLFNYL